jgi:hypothetical protein
MNAQEFSQMIDGTRLRNLPPLLIVETEEVFETLVLSQL